MLYLWRRWTRSRSAPGRAGQARWLYVAMTLGFGGLTVAAAVAGEAAVAALAGVAAVFTVGLVIMAPRLAAWMGGED